MCGILGVYNYKVSKEKFGQCLDRLVHRGPDGRGIWNSDNFRCILGHRRLSIIDLTDGGKQPMTSRNGRYSITYNGEIYNYCELKAELINDGYEFFSESDTEVVLAAYEKWGEEALNKFNGMWAFAVYDNVEQSIFLARDRFGVKPLLYSTHIPKAGQMADNGVVFASEMKAIIPLIESVTPDMDLVANSNLIMLYERTERTLIKEIKHLPAGYCMTINPDGKMMVKQWWNTLEHIPAVSNNYNEQCDEFRELFLSACRIRMRSDVTLGTALSGGLDSSATLCAMAMLAHDGDSTINKDCHHAFVASLPGTTLDETAYAKQVTDYLGIKGTDVIIDPVEGLHRMPDYIYNFEEIYYTSPVPMMQTYAAMREDGVYVTVDGHGADELFGGYMFDNMYSLLDESAFSGNRKKVLSALKEMHPNNPAFIDKRSTCKEYYDFMLRYYGRRMLRKNHNSDDYLTEEDLAIRQYPLHEQLRILNANKKDYHDFMRLSHLNRTLYNSSHKTVLPTILRNYDRYAMANGVEIRMPFMDYRIVTYAFAIEWKSKLHGGYSKSIIRDSLQDIMPEQIVRRRNKIGFNTPILEWIKGSWKEWLLDEIASTDFANSDYVMSQNVGNRIKSVMCNENATYQQASDAWTAFMPYLWDKYFYRRAVVI